MPGRKSTGPPSLAKPRPKRHDKKRSLNALSIADETGAPESKIRTARLGEIEDTAPHKRRRDNREEDDISDTVPAKRARHAQRNDNTNGNENVEFGSDESGNEWTTGQVASDEDSELDSDDALGDSDEERFADFTFRGSASQKRPVSARQGHQKKENSSGHTNEIDLGEESEADAEDDFGDEGIDLAAALDEDDGDAVADASGSDDSDGQKDTRSESLPSDSDDEFEVEDDSKLASLHSLVTNMERGGEQGKTLGHSGTSKNVSFLDSNATPRRKLTVADIASTITDPELRKSLRFLEDTGTKSSSKRSGMPQKLDVPLPKRQQDRINRAAAYEKSKETLSRWIETVKNNRRAEHLSFPVKYPDAPNPQGQKRLMPTSQSKPQTELEATIQQIMEESGLVHTNGKSGEENIRASEELKTKKMPIEEVLARRAELRKHRDLLFREEIRAKRIKKIKSKRYRKVHRREKEQNAAQIEQALNSGADSESEKERQDRRRAEERMGAKHRESRWAKAVKDSGRSKWDTDARDGIEEMARRREELRLRMHGKDVRSDDDTEETSEDNDDDDADGGDNSTLHERLHRLVNGDDERKTSNSKLSSMGFMLKANAAQQAQNDADVDALRREDLDEIEESSSESSEAEQTGRTTYGPGKSRTDPPILNRTIQRSEFEEDDASEEETVPRRRRTDVDIDRVAINPDLVAKASPAPPLKLRTAGKSVTADSRNDRDSSIASKKVKGSMERSRDAILTNGGTSNNAIQDESKEKSSSHDTRVSDSELDDVDDAQDDGSEVEQSLTFTNAELARRAFAGDDVLEQKFLAEKEDLVKEQDDQVIDTTLPGWGTWAGEGISKKASKARARHREIRKEPGINPEDRKDAKLKNVIISEKKSKKNGKYLASQLPHPFETRAQYERSLRLPVGPEWTTKESFQGMTKPRILMKQGIIAPIAKPIL